MLYTKICVSWNGVKSDTCLAINSVRQDGMISPLLFNITNKILCMRISKDNTENSEFNVTLNDSKLMWVSKVKYLGSYVRSDLNDTDDMQAKRNEFFVSLNSLLGNFKKLPSNILYNLFFLIIVCIFMVHKHGILAINILNVYVKLIRLKITIQCSRQDCVSFQQMFTITVRIGTKIP